MHIGSHRLDSAISPRYTPDPKWRILGGDNLRGWPLRVGFPAGPVSGVVRRQAGSVHPADLSSRLRSGAGWRPSARALIPGLPLPHVWGCARAIRLRLSRMTANARNLAAAGHLRPDVTVEQAGEVMWTYSSPELYELLVIKRGWPPGRYGAFIAEAMIAALLPPDPAPARQAAKRPG